MTKLKRGERWGKYEYYGDGGDYGYGYGYDYGHGYDYGYGYGNWNWSWLAFTIVSLMFSVGFYFLFVISLFRFSKLLIFLVVCYSES